MGGGTGGVENGGVVIGGDVDRRHFRRIDGQASDELRPCHDTFGQRRTCVPRHDNLRAHPIDHRQQTRQSFAINDQHLGA